MTSTFDALIVEKSVFCAADAGHIMRTRSCIMWTASRFWGASWRGARANPGNQGFAALFRALRETSFVTRFVLAGGSRRRQVPPAGSCVWLRVVVSPRPRLGTRVTHGSDMNSSPLAKGLGTLLEQRSGRVETTTWFIAGSKSPLPRYMELFYTRRGRFPLTSVSANARSGRNFDSTSQVSTALRSVYSDATPFGPPSITMPPCLSRSLVIRCCPRLRVFAGL